MSGTSEPERLGTPSTGVVVTGGSVTGGTEDGGAGATTPMSSVAGVLTTGAVVSRTVMVWRAVPMLPQLSCEVQVRLTV